MKKFRNNEVPGLSEEEYRRIYNRIHDQVYDRAYHDGYHDGKQDGYNKGYEHALKDHHYNEHSGAQHRLTDTRWHGRNSKSWSWI